MPNVNGKKFPYTAEGMRAAKKAAKKNAVLKSTPKEMKKKDSRRKKMTPGMKKNKNIGPYGQIARV